MLNNLLIFLHSHSNLATGYGKISNELPDHGQQNLPYQTNLNTFWHA